MSEQISSQTRDNSTGPIAGIILILAAVASVALLAHHPFGQAKDFSGALHEEAANQFMSGIVHGGFIVVLASQFACYAIFSQRLGQRDASAFSGLALFAVGAIFMMLSLLLDGLVIPALAARYVPQPEKIDYARSLFVLAGTQVRFLMPIGQGLQALAIIIWGLALSKSNATQKTATLGVLSALVIVSAVAFSVATGNPRGLMISIFGLAGWSLIAGVLMWRRSY